MFRCTYIPTHTMTLYWFLYKVFLISFVLCRCTHNIYTGSIFSSTNLITLLKTHRNIIQLYQSIVYSNWLGMGVSPLIQNSRGTINSKKIDLIACPNISHQINLAVELKLEVLLYLKMDWFNKRDISWVLNTKLKIPYGYKKKINWKKT